jgi:invasion protein IalB
MMASAAYIAPAIAQQATTDQPAAGQTQPADAGAAKTAEPGAAKPVWYKICDKVPVVDTSKLDPNKKDAAALKAAQDEAVKNPKQICNTLHESFDPNSGVPLVSAVIREVEGQDKKSLIVTVPNVPYGLLMPPGIAIFFDKSEKPDVVMKYDICVDIGCQAALDATPEILDKFSKATTMTVVGAGAQGETVTFPAVSMVGYNQALAGNPTDKKRYMDARTRMLLSIRNRIIQRQKATAEAAQAAAKGQQEMDAAKTGGTAAPAQGGADPNAQQATGTGN